MTDKLFAQLPIEYSLAGLLKICENKYQYIDNEEALEALDSFLSDADKDAFDEELMEYVPRVRAAYRFLKIINRVTLLIIAQNILFYRNEYPPVINILNEFIDFVLTQPMYREHFKLSLQMKFRLDPTFINDRGTQFFRKSLESSYLMLANMRTQLANMRTQVTPKETNTGDEGIGIRYFDTQSIIESLILTAGEYGNNDIADLLEEAKTWRLRSNDISLGSIIGLSIFDKAINSIRKRK